MALKRFKQIGFDHHSKRPGQNPEGFCWSGKFTHCALYPSFCQSDVFTCCSICELSLSVCKHFISLSTPPPQNYTHKFVCLLNPHSLSLSSFPLLPCTLASQSYYDEMDPKNLSIPLRLRGKRDVVFGNLLDIFKFHDQ